ncbi:MAG: carbohydrate kinase, partial [Bacteroidota bacterium]|nr:carbohydrate kinase [Bacteroidota bacterium]
DWVNKEGIREKLAPIVPSNHVVSSPVNGVDIPVGIGLHDSSAALIPYLIESDPPFLLISTGTWCISLNPFNNSPLTTEELQSDCLTYMTYQGTPVKASRYHAGPFHETQIKKISSYFNLSVEDLACMNFDQTVVDSLHTRYPSLFTGKSLDPGPEPGIIQEIDTSRFESAHEAYHFLMWEIARGQFHSTRLVLGYSGVNRIYVDGGFGKNDLYMKMLAKLFANMEVYRASVAQASALGAAIVIHSAWNQKSLPRTFIMKQLVSSSSK